MKNYSKKRVSIGWNDVLAAGGGALAGLLANGFISKVTDRIMPGNQDMMRKAIPLAKLAGGGYLAVKSKNRMVKFAGIGFAGVAAIETATQFAPETFALNGVDVFSMIGNTGDSMLLEIDPQMLKGSSGGDTADFEMDAILSSEDDYSNMAIL